MNKSVDDTPRSCYVPKPSYKVREAARLLEVGKTTLYQAIEREEVPSFKVGTTIRVPGWWVAQRLQPAA